MKKKVNLIIVGILVFVLLPVMSVALDAGRDMCKKVGIVVHNHTKDPIKVTALRYWDYDVNKWRIEVLFIPKIIKARSAKDWTHNLEHVHNDDTKIRVIYKVSKKSNWRGTYKFGLKKYYDESGKFVCKNGCVKHIHISGSHKKLR